MKSLITAVVFFACATSAEAEEWTCSHEAKPNRYALPSEASSASPVCRATRKAKARYDALQQDIRDGAALVAADAEEIRRMMYRGGDEASPELITLKARQDMRQRKLASDKSTLSRVREYLSKLPGNATGVFCLFRHLLPMGRRSLL